MYDARIIFLFEKYKNRQSSPAEELELLGYFTDPTLENKLKVLLGDAFDRESAEQGLHEDRVHHVLAGIYERIAEQQPGTSVSVVRRNKLDYWVAAAVTLLFLSLGGYYGWNRAVDNRMVLVKQQVLSKKVGWTNQLTLTLSDGKLQVLDELQAGETIEDAGLRIRKITEDEIWYEPFDLHTVGAVAAIHRLDVPYGRQMRLKLADGSRVMLNACSSLIYYPFAMLKKERWAKLEGEAYFEIKKKTNPFRIEAKQGQINVLGTRFNVLAYPDEQFMKATLVDGRIRLNQVLMAPGQQATLKKGEISLKKVDTGQVIAWTNGYLTLDNENIYSVMRKIARWYHVEVIYQGTPPLEGLGGVVKKFTHVEDLLDVLTELGGVHFQLLKPLAEGKERRVIVIP